MRTTGAPGGTWRLRGARLAVAAVLVAAGTAHPAPALRKQVDLNGDFVLFGNTLGWECAASPPPMPLEAPIVGWVGGCGVNTSDSSPDIFWVSDYPDPGEACADISFTPADARSTGMLNLPVGATVTYARIYWAAMQPDWADISGVGTSALVERPGLQAQRVASDRTWSQQNGLGGWWYQSSADVTSIVSALGAGAYRVGGFERSDGLPWSVDLGLDLATGQRDGIDDNLPFAAWAVVVFYQAPGGPMRNLALFDGFDIVAGTATADVSVSGFRVPASGFQAKLGVLAYEGDVTLTGDSLSFNGHQLHDAQNPADNFFNGTYSYLGTPVSQLTSAVDRGSNAGDLPQLAGTPGSMSGVDIDVVDVTQYVHHGDTSAAIQAATNGDAYVVGAIVTSISTLRPDFGGTTKSWQNLTRAGGTLAGDTLQYTVVVANTGNDASVNTVLVDVLPPGVTYVPDSIAIDGVGKSDVPGDDDALFSGGIVTAYLGAGATPTSGGSLPAGGASTVTFRVVVNGTPGASIDNQAMVSAAGLLGDPQTIYPSHPPGTGAGPTSTIVDQCATAADCSPAAGFCYTTPSPHLCVQPPAFAPAVSSGRATAGSSALFRHALGVFYGSDAYDLAAQNSAGCGFRVELLADATGLPGVVLAVDETGDGVWEAIASGADSNGNGRPDTGILATPGSAPVWLRVTPPASAPAGSTCTTTLTATGASTGLAAFAVDTVTVVPPPPVIGSPPSGATLVSGTPTLAGTGSPGAALTVTGGSASYGPIAVDASGAWSYTLAQNEALAPGSHTLCAVQSQGGATSDPSACITFAVSAVAPSITWPASGYRTNRASLVLVGVANGAPDTVRVELDDGGAATSLPLAAVAAGGFGFSLSGAMLAEGTHSFTVRLVDAFGNRSVPSAPVLVVVDRTPPAPPVLAPMPATIRADPLAISGSAEPGAVVRVLLDGVGVASGVADASGTFTFLVSGIPEGPHLLSAVAVDAAQNVGDPSPEIAFIVDRTAPASPILEPIASPVRSSRLVVVGHAGPGSTVLLSLDGAELGSTVADGSGAFTLELASLGDGAHVLGATAADTAGNVSAPTTATFQVETGSIQPQPASHPADPDARAAMCGCSHGSGAMPFALLGLLALRLRRRSR